MKSCRPISRFVATHNLKKDARLDEGLYSLLSTRTLWFAPGSSSIGSNGVFAKRWETTLDKQQGHRDSRLYPCLTMFLRLIWSFWRRIVLLIVLSRCIFRYYALQTRQWVCAIDLKPRPRLIVFGALSSMTMFGARSIAICSHAFNTAFHRSEFNQEWHMRMSDILQWDLYPGVDSGKVNLYLSMVGSPTPPWLPLLPKRGPLRFDAKVVVQDCTYQCMIRGDRQTSQ